MSENTLVVNDSEGWLPRLAVLELWSDDALDVKLVGGVLVEVEGERGDDGFGGGGALGVLDFFCSSYSHRNYWG